LEIPQQHAMMVITGVNMAGRGLLSTVLVVSLLTLSAAGQQSPSSAAPNSAKTNDSANDPSGMYSFLREGEFVQLTIDDGKLSGYISRFGDTESDKGTFIDQFFDKASLDGERLSFTTKTVHGTWYEFTGAITKAPGKQPAQEGYRVLKGTLVQHMIDANKVDKSRPREVEFKSFPQDLSRP
jgi:hypothetical protein